jgi:hypothetical protein
MKQRTWFKVIFSAAVVTALTFSGCNQAATPEGEEAVEGQAGQQAANSGNSEGSGGGVTSWFGSSEPEPEPRSVTLDASTPISVRTTNALSTKDVTTGEGFVGSLEEPIVQGDWVVAQKGATVRGVVANADKGGRVKGVAALSIRVTQIETSDGQTIDVNTSAYGVQAKSTKKKDGVKVGIASGIGAAIGAIAGGGSGAAKGAGIGAGAGGGVVLATRGDPAVISSESVVTVTLQNPVTITEAL